MTNLLVIDDSNDFYENLTQSDLETWTDEAYESQRYLDMHELSPEEYKLKYNTTSY